MSKQLFIHRLIDANREVLSAVETVDALRREFTAMDYATNMTDADLADMGVSKAQFLAAATSLAALVEWLETNGHFPKLYILRR